MAAPLSRAEWRRRKRRKAMINRIIVFTVLAALLVALICGGIQLYRNIFMHEQLGTLKSAGDTEVLERFLEISEYSRPGTVMRKTEGIIIHDTGIPGASAMDRRNYYNSLAATGANHMSSHFIVDLDGKIIQCIPVNEQSLANGVYNGNTISIEFCYTEEDGTPSAATVASLRKLTATLMNRFGLTDARVYRHSEISQLEEIVCPVYYREEAKWLEFLTESTGEAELLKQKKR